MDDCEQSMFAWFGIFWKILKRERHDHFFLRSKVLYQQTATTVKEPGMKHVTFCAELQHHSGTPATVPLLCKTEQCSYYRTHNFKTNPRKKRQASFLKNISSQLSVRESRILFIGQRNPLTSVKLTEFLKRSKMERKGASLGLEQSPSFQIAWDFMPQEEISPSTEKLLLSHTLLNRLPHQDLHAP